MEYRGDEHIKQTRRTDMVDLLEAILCSDCSCGSFCEKDRLDCPANHDGEVYTRDITIGVMKWLNSFDTSSATKCFEAVNILKERLEKDGNSNK